MGGGAITQYTMQLSKPTLFNARLIFKRRVNAPTPAAHKQILHDWAATIRDGSISKKGNKEAAIRSAFIQNIFVKVLGYVPFGSGAGQTLVEEYQAGAGRADAALGHFRGDAHQVIAPVELKGADTANLDAIMPSRHKSPVHQAWEYAADIPNRKFIVLSNMIEIRLYAYAHTRQVYESFDILELANSDTEYQRFMLLLGAENFLSGQTEKLLAESTQVEATISNDLYSDYREWRIQLILALAQHNDLPLSDVITYAQTVLDRVLFIAFAEDRELLPSKTIASAYQTQNFYAPQPVWENFKGLFRAVDKGNPHLGIPAYNGGLFRPNEKIDALIVPDETCKLFKQLGDYDFATEISVTVLGHIFEQSVAELEELRSYQSLADFRQKSTEIRAASGVSGKRKAHGIVYTPDHITAFIVEQTLVSYLNDQREAVRAVYVTPAVGRDLSQQAADEGMQVGLKPDLRDDDLVPYRKATPVDKKRVGKLRQAERVVELLFWQHWRDVLQTIKIVDPACGSGAFLIAAFDVLKAEYHQVNEQITTITGTADLFDINLEILNGNLYGVDLTPESIEISKLSLWLKTAQRGKPLQSLEANLRVGNSLIAEMNGGREFSERAFDWQGAFPQVFRPHPNPVGEGATNSPRPLAGEGAGERAGFDVVLGNPPYVRQERFGEFKSYLQQHYAVYHGVADLYCYFYELGVNLLKTGGRLGYISSSTFFKTGSGEPLRRYLLEKTLLRAMVDFGDLQVFEGVTTYPAIVVLEKRPLPNPLPQAGEGTASTMDKSVGGISAAHPPELNAADALTLIYPTTEYLAGELPSPACGRGVGGEGVLHYLNLKSLPDEGLSAAFAKQALPMPQARLGAGSWQLESDAQGQLRDKLTHGHRTLKQVYGSPLYGIKTGLNDAFVIDRATHDRLIAQDPKSAELLKPFLEGKDLKKWRVEPQDLWLILCPKGWTHRQCGLSDEVSAQAWMVEHYPAVMAWLEPFETAAKKRTDKGAFWWELRACAYYEEFEKSKIIYPDLSQGSKFSFDSKGYYSVNTCYFYAGGDLFLLGILNSKAIWSYLQGICDAMRGGEWRLRLFTENMDRIPIPTADDTQRVAITTLAESCQRAAETRRDCQAAFRHRISDLCPLPSPFPQAGEGTKLPSPTRGRGAGGEGVCIPKLTTKLNHWWELDFAAFRAETKKLFKQDIPLTERNDWEAYFNQQRAIVLQHTADITQLERALNQHVYALFHLTPAEIALIESAA